MDYSEKSYQELINIINSLEEKNTSLEKRIKALLNDRDRFERESNNNYSFLRNLIDSLPIALYFLDQKRILVECNKAFENLIKKEKSEIFGKNFKEINFPELFIEEEKGEGPYTPSSKIISFEKGDKTDKILFSEYRIHGISENFYGSVGFLFNISENQDLFDNYLNTIENNKALSDINSLEFEIEEDSRLKDDFLAIISHELRTPLNAVIGMAEALEEGVFGELAERQVAPLSRIIESSKNLLSIVNDLLQLSKIIADKVQINISSVYPASLVERIFGDYTNIIKQKEFIVKIENPESLKVIYADERLLSRALRNIIDNSMKFTATKGEIGIKFSAQPELDIIKICLWDTGIGIPTDRLKSIFEPFLQIDSGLKRQYGGMGLGLALVFRIIDLQNGSIHVKSVVNKGTRFCISLPTEPRLSASGEENIAIDNYIENEDFLALRKKPEGLPKILFAGNKVNNLKQIADIFTRLGFNLIISRTIENITKRIALEKPQIAFIDIDLLGSKYKKIISEIQAYKLTSKIPILIASSLDLDDIKEKIFEAGVDDFVAKPLTIKKMLKLVKNHLYKD